MVGVNTDSGAHGIPQLRWMEALAVRTLRMHGPDGVRFYTRMKPSRRVGLPV